LRKPSFPVLNSSAWLEAQLQAKLTNTDDHTANHPFSNAKECQRHGATGLLLETFLNPSTTNA